MDDIGTTNIGALFSDVQAHERAALDHADLLDLDLGSLYGLTRCGQYDATQAHADSERDSVVSRLGVEPCYESFDDPGGETLGFYFEVHGGAFVQATA